MSPVLCGPCGLKRCPHDVTLCGGTGGSRQSYWDCVIDHERKLVHKKRQLLGQLNVVFLIHLLLCIHPCIGISLLYVCMHKHVCVCVCVCVCMCVCVCVCVCTFVWVHLQVKHTWQAWITVVIMGEHQGYQQPITNGNYQRQLTQHPIKDIATYDWSNRKNNTRVVFSSLINSCPSNSKTICKLIAMLPCSGGCYGLHGTSVQATLT